MLIALAGTALAQARGNADEAKQMVQDALAYVKQAGTDKAFEDFTTATPGSRWHKKDLIVFCYKFDGTCVCNGNNKALMGKNLLEFKYPDGHTRIKEMVDIVKSKGNGAIEYSWPDPITKKIGIKQAFVSRIPGYDGFLAVGIYK
jgi:signal transduction histidine kinase